MTGAKEYMKQGLIGIGTIISFAIGGFTFIPLALDMQPLSRTVTLVMGSTGLFLIAVGLVWPQGKAP